MRSRCVEVMAWRLRSDADNHDHEADPVFVPASQPADLPVTEAGAERYRGPQARNPHLKSLHEARRGYDLLSLG